MSGFDFEALRDPDAPQPDSRHRDGVEARAHELRAKARRNRAIVSALALAVVVAAVAGIVATRPDEHQVIVTDPSSTTAPPPSSSIGDRFVPPTTTENGITTLPVTLPDGETFTMKYPEQMKIAQLGFAGSIGVNWPSCCNKQVSITYQTIADVYGDATPIHVYRGRNGEAIPYFHEPGVAPNEQKIDYLVFQFGPWLVQVDDVPETFNSEPRMTEAQRETWARSLTGTVEANGYLLLHAAAPLSLGNGFEGAFGANPGNVVELGSHTACGQPESDTNVRRRFTDKPGPHLDAVAGVAWCAGDLHVSATGTKTFVDLAADELEIGFLATPATSTTTTTTTPAATSARAISASFVSRTHGWVLLQSGAIGETTDGGRSWKTIASVGAADPLENYVTPQIRFADATRGFVHTDRNFFTTGDGGAHWQRLDAPFGSVTDLAISRGIVYLVAYDENPKNGIQFVLWSSPTDHLSWSRDPLTLPIGAGPVPIQQLVFSGGNGWVTNGDRGLMGGARLSASGHWETWKPPCLGAYASLAASTATDLVASCQAGVWTGPKITNWLYFSHDAGKTFDRRSTPTSGAIASPNATTAVLAANGVLRRTTDQGVSWSEVAREPNANSALDLGFTTSTQGFVIFDNGTMLMTHDAGATWSAATKP